MEETPKSVCHIKHTYFLSFCEQMQVQTSVMGKIDVAKRKIDQNVSRLF